MEKLVAYKRMPLWTKENHARGCSAKAQYQGWDLGQDYCFKKELSSLLN